MMIEKDHNFQRRIIIIFLTHMFLVHQDSLVSANGVKSTTCCSDGLGLNYTLPMFNECKEKPHPNGGMVQTIPKLIPYTDKEAACPRRKSKLGIPPGHRVCRFPDCHENTCQNGWCEETMIDFECHCPEGYEGKRCDKQSPSTEPTTEPVRTTGEENVFSTPESTTTESTTDAVIITGEENVSSTPESTTTESTTDAVIITDQNVPSTPESPMTGSNTEAVATESPSTEPTAEPVKTTGEENVPSTPESTTTESTTDAVIVTDKSVPSTSESPMAGSNTDEAVATEQSAKIYVTGKSSNGRGIFVADLQNLAFIKIPSSSNPRRISYDSKEMKIYWTDPSDKLVYRADMNGTNREEVITPYDNGNVTSITIAEQSRTLYIAHKQRKVTSVSIDNVEGNGPFPRNQTDFVTDLSSKPTSLEVDETEGFLYLAMGRFIKRKSLNGDNDVEDVYGSSSRITGISIDASRNPPRIFFCDYKEDNISRSFYMDTATPFKGVNVTELTTHLHDLELRPEKWTDVAYFKGSIYWTSRDPTGIAVMNNYDQDDPSCNITVPGFRKLNRLLIIDNQKSWPGSWPTGSNNGQTSLSQSYAYEGDSTNSSSSDD